MDFSCHICFYSLKNSRQEKDNNWRHCVTYFGLTELFKTLYSLECAKSFDTAFGHIFLQQCKQNN